MTTISYPAVGNGGLTEAQWSTLYGATDGIYNDFTANGNAFELQLISAGSVARILAPTVPSGATAPVIKVNGYGLQVTANEDFTVPDPATTTTYSIYAQYDPALNVADGSGNAIAAGPVRLRLDATLDTSGGKQNVVLYTIRRTPGQALSAITPNDYRRWVAPTLSGALLSDTESYPRGTIHTAVSGTTYIREPSGATMVWKPFAYTAGTAALTYQSGFGAVVGESAARYTIPTRSGTVHMTGTIRRTNGAAIHTGTGSDVTVATIPPEHAPSTIKRYTGVYESGGDSAAVIVTPAGNILVRPNGITVSWVDLSTISYQIGT